jgi:hypothetical protein
VDPDLHIFENPDLDSNQSVKRDPGIRIHTIVKRQIRIRIKVKIAMKAQNRGVEAQDGAMPWRVCMPVVADLHDFIVAGSGSVSIKGKGRIRIRIKNVKVDPDQSDADPQRTFSDIRTTRGKKILCN